MFKDEEAERTYIMANYPEVTNSRIDEDHWILFAHNAV